MNLGRPSSCTPPAKAGGGSRAQDSNRALPAPASSTTRPPAQGYMGRPGQQGPALRTHHLHGRVHRSLEPLLLRQAHVPGMP
jgi:hypothetical protein